MSSTISTIATFLRGNGRHFPIALLLVAQSLSAATYYVATNGNDGNSGSASAPFLTLQQAVNNASAGDTVVVFDGTYGNNNAVTGGDSDGNEHSAVTLYNSGAPGAPITITSANQWGAVLDCQMLCDSYFNLYNASYIVIQNFVITHGYKEGIHSNDSAHDITLQGNRIEYIANRASSATTGLDGMYVNPNCYNFTITGNTFHDIGRTNANQLDHGLYLHGSNFTIANNVFYNIPNGFAIQAADGLNTVLIANNTFAFPEANNQAGQIMLWNTQSNLTIENNIFYNPKNYAINRYTSTLNGCSISNNLVYGASGMMADSSGCTVSATRNADPQFVNATSQPLDFHLQANSPAIAAGISLGPVQLDFSGMARPQNDVGAFEYTAPPFLQLGNTTTGGNTWSVGQGWALGIVGAAPRAQVMVSVGAWSGVVGYADDGGNFSTSGSANAGNIGTTDQTWTVGGAIVNPQSVVVTVFPGF